jgi:hypothetical protein
MIVRDAHIVTMLDRSLDFLGMAFERRVMQG